MNYKILNNTDLRVSNLALGTDVYGSYLDSRIAVSLLDYFYEKGGNVLDTANIYGPNGESEKLIGAWMNDKSNRQNIIISTKGAHPNPNTMHISRLSKEDIENDINESLRRLKTDYIDIYWLHRDNETLPVEPIIDTLDGLIKQGKIRYIGMSNWRGNRIEKCLEYSEKSGKSTLFASQIQYSIASPNFENNDQTLVIMNDTEYDFYKNHKLTLFAYASQAKGFFQRMDNGGIEGLSEKAKTRYLNDISVKRFDRIKKLSSEIGKSVGEIAISSVSSNYDFDTIPIVGCKNIIQLEESINGANLKLAKEQIEYILA